MYYPPEFPSYHHQMNPDFQQHYPNQTYPPTAPSLQPYTNTIPPYSPSSPQDRPSPSFRIEDILLQNKASGHTPGGPYANVYQNPYYPNYNNSVITHGCMNDRDLQGPNNQSLNNLPVYFRLRPNLRQSNGRKCRKPRTVFSELQLMVLEREFNEHKYLSTPQRTKLADKLGLNQTQVKTWYQNRRMKWKKESSEKKPTMLSDVNNNTDNNNNNNNTTESRNETSLTHSLVEQIQPTRSSEPVNHNI